MMIKKFSKTFVLLIAIVIMCTSFVLVSAEDTTSVAADTINKKFDPDNVCIEVWGTLKTNRAGTNLLLRMLDESGDEVFVEYTTTRFSVGESEPKVVEYNFGKVMLPADLPSGNYRIEVSGHDIKPYLQTSYEFSGDDRILKVMLAVEAAQKSNTVGTVILGEIDGILNKDILDIEVEDYESFGENGKKAFENIMKDVTYTLPDDPSHYVDPVDKEAIKDARKTFRAEYKKAIASGLFAEATDSEKVASWLAKYYEDSDLKLNEDATITEWLAETKTDADFIRRISEATAPMTIDEIKDYIYESVLLSVIKSKSDKDVKKILFEEEKLEKYFPGLNKTAFLSLDANIKPSVIMTISGTEYDTCKDAVDAINKLIENSYDLDDDEYYESPSGGGVRLPNAPVKSEVESVPQKSFTDLDDVEWAREAIEFLYDKGIVNGKQEGIYAPNDNITRAEFVKIVATSLGITGSISDMPFVDIDKGSWYAPYVAAVYEAKIVMGDENGYFNPETNITRQDMATILYRSMGVTSKNDAELSFTDNNKISDYAKEAVAYLASRQIINGFQDGRFGALENATRAQTAVMVYNIIKNPVQ